MKLTPKVAKMIAALVDNIQGGIEDYNDCWRGWGSAEWDRATERLVLTWTPEVRGEQANKRSRIIFQLVTVTDEPNPYWEPV